MMMLFLLIIVVVNHVRALLPENFEKAVRDATQPVLDEYGKRFNTSFQIGLTFDGGQKFEMFSGIDDHSSDPPTLLKQNTLIPMGSATKIYTAVAIMQLYERGIIDIDRPVHEIVDPFLNRTNGTTLLELWGEDKTINQVTTRELMGMRGCLSDYDDGKLQSFVLNPSNAGVTIDPYDYLHVWAQKSFLCEPGSGGAYSSIGFVILGFVAASATNATTWKDFDQKSIFPDALRDELDSLIFSLGGRCSDEVEQNVSHQYAATFSSHNNYWTTIHWEDIYNFDCLNGWTMGNIAAKASDTSTALYHLFSPNTKTPLVSKESLKQMKDFKPLTVGWSVGLEYGLGMMRANYFHTNGVPSNLTTFVGHAGQDYGSSAYLHEYNEALDIAITLSSNTEYGMNCSLNPIMENFQDSSELGCHVWDEILQIVTNGSVGRLACTGTDRRRLSHHHHRSRRQLAVKQNLPIYCDEGCSGTSANLDSDECNSWKEFYSAANGAYWARFRDNFADPCGIPDVICQDGHIVEMNLSYVGAASTIPSILGSFSKLRTLDLSHNFFFGSIPQSINQLQELTKLDLSECLFSSTLPSLNFSKYNQCEIIGNDFDCPLPTGSSEFCGATCDSGPNISTACKLGWMSIASDTDIQSKQSNLDQAIGSAVGALAAKECASQLEKNRTCTLSIDLSKGSIGTMFANLSKAADQKNAKVCAMNLEKKQQCDNFGPCEIRIGNTTAIAIASECDNENDLSAYLSWLGRPSQCIKESFGSSCVYSLSNSGDC